VDFIPQAANGLDYLLPLFFVLLGIGAVYYLLVIVLAIWNIKHEVGAVGEFVLDSFGVAFILVPASALVFGVAFALFHTNEAASIQADQRESAKVEIDETYGIELTGDQVLTLDYPEEKPTEDFQVFGSFDQREQTDGVNFTERTVYLVWADGKFGLSQSEDGENFESLELKR